jgi:hypothetical protein
LERERRQREIERERRATDPRERDRLRREHRDEARRSRERSIAEREMRRRVDRDRYIRDRDENRRRIGDHRRDWHRDFDRWRRPLPPQRRPDYRDPQRWRDRYENWRYGTYRPLPPPPPRYVIIAPFPYPDYADYWDVDDIYQMAAWVETYAFRIYEAMRPELSAPTPWNLETLSAMYDVVEASRIYFDAVDRSVNVYRDTIYELFYLEETVRIAQVRVLCGPLSEYVRDNFNQMKYFVDELLWQYRLDFNDQVFTLNSTLDVNRDFDVDEDIVACESYNFPWPKPHRSVYWDLRGSEGFVRADTLVLSSLNAGHEQGRSGVARISSLVVDYSDGSREDLIARARTHRDPHFNHKGELILGSPTDQIFIPINSFKDIKGIAITADSWIAASIDAVLSLALVRDGRATVIGRP